MAKATKAKSSKKKTGKAAKAAKTNPLFELHVRLDEIADLPKMISAQLEGWRERIVDTVQDKTPEKAAEAGQALVNFLGRIGIEEVKFRGYSFKPVAEKTEA